MNRFIKLSVVAAAAALSASAFAAVAIDANLELDTKIANKSGKGAPNGGMSQGGRVEFNAAGKAGDANGFVAARGTLLITKTDGAAVDDMWGQIGTGMADVKFGKFEAADLFPAGKDVYVEDDLKNAGSSAGYKANTLRGRFGNSSAHLALTVNAAPGVSFELGFVDGKNTTAGNTNKGVRPVVSFAAGPVSVKLGLESGKDIVTGVKFDGVGGTVAVPLMGGTVNFNLASGKVKPVSGDIKSTSFGVVGVFGPAGVAFVADKTGTLKQNTVYVAYSLPLFATGATITPAYSYSKSKQDTADGAASGVAVRVNYAF